MNSKISAFLLAVLFLAGACLAKGLVSDDMIYNNVRIKLASDEVVKGGALQVDVKDGVVTLGGSVEQDRQKERAAKLARRIKGVKQVVNNITIRSKNDSQ